MRRTGLTVLLVILNNTHVGHLHARPENLPVTDWWEAICLQVLFWVISVLILFMCTLVIESDFVDFIMIKDQGSRQDIQLPLTAMVTWNRQQNPPQPGVQSSFSLLYHSLDGAHKAEAVKFIHLVAVSEGSAHWDPLVMQLKQYRGHITCTWWMLTLLSISFLCIQSTLHKILQVKQWSLTYSEAQLQ